MLGSSVCWRRVFGGLKAVLGHDCAFGRACVLEQQCYTLEVSLDGMVFSGGSVS